MHFDAQEVSLLEPEGVSVVRMIDPLSNVCGDPFMPDKHIVLQAPSLAALSQFQQITATADSYHPAKFALKLLSILLATTNCRVQLHTCRRQENAQPNRSLRNTV